MGEQGPQQSTVGDPGPEPWRAAHEPGRLHWVASTERLACRLRPVPTRGRLAWPPAVDARLAAAPVRYRRGVLGAQAPTNRPMTGAVQGWKEVTLVTGQDGRSQQPKHPSVT
jgi:hypothetical protein